VLTLAQLPHTIVDGEIFPGWLTPKDHAWLRVLLEELEALVGAPMEVVDAELAARTTRRAGPRRPALGAACETLLRLCSTAVDAPAAPAALRREVFEGVARRPRGERLAVLVEVAAAVGVSPETLRAALFADRPGARRLLAPATAVSEIELAERTNLAVAQAFLARSEAVVVRAGAQARSVVRLAKLRRLICAARVDPGGEPSVHVSGPLALFHRTTKYGGALASFVPALVSTPAWSLEAHCVVDGRRLLFRADDSLPLARTHVLPRTHDSDVERRLDRDLRKIARGWSLSREADVVQVGARLFFPDFTLVRGRDRVLVEVVGFYTRDYLDKKLEALRSVALPIIVLVDEDLACDDEEIAGDVVLRYRRRPDAEKVIAAAELLAARR